MKLFSLTVGSGTSALAIGVVCSSTGVASVPIDMLGVGQRGVQLLLGSIVGGEQVAIVILGNWRSNLLLVLVFLVAKVFIGGLSENKTFKFIIVNCFLDIL